MQRRKRRRMALLARTLFITIIVLIITGTVCLIKHLKCKETSAQLSQKIVENPPDYEVDLLDINDYSRPGLTLEKVNGIVIHYTPKSGNYGKTEPELF